ncbi:uncharacterized protein LOC143288297 [Babylonia areolata]|uniref:uncharacterized protein LOC143288297 n=1 Tax=Babylonia areolata TaxID=304850 RepID=UPI003FCFB938
MSELYSQLMEPTNAMNYFDEQYFGASSEAFQDAARTTEDVAVVGVKGQSLTSAQRGVQKSGTNIPPAEDWTKESSGQCAGTDSYSQPLSHTRHQADSFIDEVYFPMSTDSFSSSETLDHSSISENNRTCSAGEDNCQNSYSFIEEQYFSDQFPANTPAGINHPGQGGNPTETKDHLCEEEASPSSPIPCTHTDLPSDRTKHFNGNTDTGDGASRTNTTEPQSSGPVPNESRRQPPSRAETRQPSAHGEFSFFDQQYFESQPGELSALENTAINYGIQSQEVAWEHTLPDKHHHQPRRDIAQETADAHHHQPRRDTAQETADAHHHQPRRDIAQETADAHHHQPRRDTAQETADAHHHQPRRGIAQETADAHHHQPRRGIAQETADHLLKPGLRDGMQEPVAGWSSSRGEGVGADRGRRGEEGSAFHVAMELRKNLRFNSAPGGDVAGAGVGGSRVQMLKEQVPNVDHMTSAEVTQLLAGSLLFENDDFIAVNKPYGLPSHGGPGVRVSVGQLLQPLAERLHRGRHSLDGLHLVHRLDKDTTGVMLLARTAEVAWQLVGMFRRREVCKTYWAITKGLPQPPEGVIDIPLVRENVNGVYKTVVRPEQRVEGGAVKRRGGRGADSRAAVTQYRVLAHLHSMALLECRPLTGLQHQIRVHLAQALNCPVLGDHKYSHMDRLAPQKLFPEALQKLGLRQAQVRYLPLHLHAKALLLPEWRGHSNIFIAAPVPRFFLRNLKTLKIKIPPR